MMSRALPVANWIAIIAALGLGWQVTALAIADYYALSRPEWSLAWDGVQSEALVALAEQRLDSEELPVEELSALARSALLNEPLNPVPLRAFGLIAEEAGKDELAERLMRLAEGRSLHDVGTQVWFADLRLLNEDYPGAMRHIDALLRVWPAFGGTLYPVLSDLAADPASAEALISRLQTGPPWRSSFLATLPGSREEAAELVRFYEGMTAGPAPVTMDELRPYLAALIAQDNASTAYAAWQDSLSPGARPEPLNVYNGGFERDITNVPFDWTLANVKGAQADQTQDERGGHSLRVQFYSTRVPFQHVSQVLVLRPGPYRLMGEVKASRLQNPRGIQWTMSCAAGSREVLGETERMSGTIPWTPFEMLFDVPAGEGCRSQVLRLRLAARIAAEQQVSGEVWFDDLRIESVTGAVRSE